MKKILLIILLFLGTTPIQASNLSNGWYTISPSSNLTIRLNVTKSNVNLKRAANISGQKFYLQKLNDGSFKIGTGATAGVSVIDGNKDHQKWNSNTNQKWTIASSGDYFTIKNKATQKFLSFNGSTLNTNTTVSLWKLQPYNEKFTVTFISGGKTIKRESVKSGAYATYPTLSTRTGYKFINWDTTSSKITKNTTVKANWEQYVTFEDKNPDINYINKLKDKTIANKIMEMVNKGEDILLFYTSAEKEKYSEALEAIKKTYLKYYGSFRIKSSASGVNVGGTKIVYSSISEDIKKSAWIKSEAVKEAKKIFTKGMKVTDAIKALDDYFRNNYRYDSRLGGSIYHMLYNKAGVCEGYASLAQLLCDIAGIDCLYVHGDADGNHVWNKININDKWYWVDFTWDKSSRKYYLSEELWGDHTFKSEKQLWR